MRPHAERKAETERLMALLSAVEAELMRISGGYERLGGLRPVPNSWCISNAGFAWPAAQRPASRRLFAISLSINLNRVFHKPVCSGRAEHIARAVNFRHGAHEHRSEIFRALLRKRLNTVIETKL
jgi:hypothetical protein